MYGLTDLAYNSQIVHLHHGVDQSHSLKWRCGGCTQALVQACDFMALERFLSRVKSQSKELKVFPGAFHELLKGPEQQATLDAMTEWMLRLAHPGR